MDASPKASVPLNVLAEHRRFSSHRSARHGYLDFGVGSVRVLNMGAAAHASMSQADSGTPELRSSDVSCGQSCPSSTLSAEECVILCVGLCGRVTFVLQPAALVSI